jgi:hypothetical protein
MLRAARPVSCVGPGGPGIRSIPTLSTAVDQRGLGLIACLACNPHLPYRFHFLVVETLLGSYNRRKVKAGLRQPGCFAQLFKE